MKCSKIKITYFLLGFVLLWGGGLHAATIHVYIHAVGNADGSDWDNAYTTIQDGIDNASPGDEVWVVAWIFNESITLKSGVSLYGGFSQFDDQLSDRNLRYKTIIDGTGLNSSVVTMSEITDSKIDGFTIRGGNVNSLNSPDPEGGGFRILSADQSNEISHCSVVGNSGDEGGGMYIYDSSPIITNTIIGGNKGFNAGAGVAVYDSDVTFDSCHFSGNESSIGSAFFTLSSAITIKNSVIDGNRSSGNSVCFLSSSSLSMSNCTITNNVSSSDDGVLFIVETSFQIVNSIFDNNFPQAIFVGDNNYSLVSGLSNNLFNNNWNGDYSDPDSGVLSGAVAINSLTNSSGNLDGDPKFKPGLTGNWTDFAVYNPEIDVTTFYDTLSEYDPDAHFPLSLRTLPPLPFVFSTNSLIGRVLRINTLEDVYAVVVENSTYEIMVHGDLRHLASTGTESYHIVDYHLDSGSAAIDAGTQIGASNTDIDGDTRPFNGLVDIGADERTELDLVEEESGGSNSPCFIATAAYGTPLAQEIDLLRSIRDEQLLTNSVGTVLVDGYYRVSPPVADVISRHPVLKSVVKNMLNCLIVSIHNFWTLIILVLGINLVRNQCIRLKLRRIS